MSATKTRKRTYRCGICDAPLRDEHWIYSSHTHSRYCHPSDWEACSKRSLRAKKAAK